MREVGGENGKIVTLVDTPGTEDTESSEVDVANGYGVYKALIKAKTIVPIIVMSRENIGTRSQKLKDAINFLAKMVKNPISNISYFSFIINHMPRHNSENAN